jgi:hypothetical protein
MFSVSSRNKDKEMFMTGSQEVVGSNPIFSIANLCEGRKILNYHGIEEVLSTDSSQEIA